MGEDRKTEGIHIFPDKGRVGIYPADDLKNVEVCLREESLSLSCTVREAKCKCHGQDFMDLGFGSSEGKSYQPRQRASHHDRCPAEME